MYGLEYQTIQALRNGVVIDLNGIKFEIDAKEDRTEKDIKPGDLYMAKRNTGTHLLTAAKVVEPVERPNGHGGWIIPTTNYYHLNTWECVKVREV